MPARNPVTSSRQSIQKATLAVLLLVTTLALYWPAGGHDFILYDDQDYVTANQRVKGGLSGENIAWAFTSRHASNWHPLTWMSHMADVEWFGLNAGAHHLMNAALHAGNSALLLLVLIAMTGATWRSAVVAALFAWHPLHVESVAWVAERKDVLSTLFLILTIGAYARYGGRWNAESRMQKAGEDRQKARREHSTTNIQQPTSNIERRAKVQSAKLNAQGPTISMWYGLALVFFALGLMSKPMLVTLPFVLLLLDYWPLRRFEISTLDLRLLRRLLREKLPFFALTIGSCVLTVWAQKEVAIKALEQFPLMERVANAAVAYGMYLWKSVFPAGLAVFYPYPDSPVLWKVIVAVCALAAITALVLRFARTHRFLVTGWLWYLGTLVPVIGLVQVGSAAMADRYTYVPLIGWFIMVVWGATALARENRLAQKLLGAGAVILLAACALSTARQLVHWKNEETLFRRAVEVTRNNALANFNLGTALEKREQYEEALACFREVLRIYPDEPDTHRMMGVILARLSRIEEAAHHLKRAEAVYRRRLENTTRDAEAAASLASTELSLGLARVMQGEQAAAVPHFRKAIELDPEAGLPRNELAWILATHPDPALRNGDEAVRLAVRACELTEWRRLAFMGTLDAAYAEAGRFADAIAMARRLIAQAEKEGDAMIAELASKRLELYRAGRAYREEAPR